MNFINRGESKRRLHFGLLLILELLSSKLGDQFSRDFGEVKTLVCSGHVPKSDMHANPKSEMHANRKSDMHANPKTDMQTLKVACMTSKHYLMMHALN